MRIVEKSPIVDFTLFILDTEFDNSLLRFPMNGNVSKEKDVCEILLRYLSSEKWKIILTICNKNISCF